MYFRYASKAYNSESDYGSEYGIEEGRIREPSDAGTLRSKYSRGDNTLSRYNLLKLIKLT